MTDLRVAFSNLWTGTGKQARIARAILSPLTHAYGAVVRGRAILYDRGLLKAHDVSVPVVSVGNLTVGGTGKTPVAAWLARQLVERGAHPAVVLRGPSGVTAT